MALGTVTVGSASTFHAERSGREIQGSHGDLFRAIFSFQLRTPMELGFFCWAPGFSVPGKKNIGLCCRAQNAEILLM